MSIQYRHSQPGYLAIVTCVILVGAGSICFVYGPRLIGVILGATGLSLLPAMYKLSVEIKDGFLRFWFGVGVFWKKIAIDRIAYCEPYKSFICGWGIHWMPWESGWLYNVSGLQAVTVVLKSGKKMHIGTDEPAKLIEAINSAIRGTDADAGSGMWSEVKTDYLRRVGEALSAARHPRGFEILGDVSGHLDQRYAELGEEERTWDNFQKIITEMGAPGEYVELVGEAKPADRRQVGGYVVGLILILGAAGAGMILLPRFLHSQEVRVEEAEFVSDPEVIGKWVSVDFVTEMEDFRQGERQWGGDLFLKQVIFNPSGTTTLGWRWTKGWVIHSGSGIRAEYAIASSNGATYLFLPWLSGDVTIRHQKPKYYVMKKVSAGAVREQELMQKLLGGGPGGPAAVEKGPAEEQAVIAAVEAARAWLELVDEHAYNQSWAEAAEIFRKSIGQEQWAYTLEANRGALGAVVSRKVMSRTFTRRLPGAPDGQYVVIQFETSFENKREAVETVTPMLDSDGLWRVSGYYIR